LVRVLAQVLPGSKGRLELPVPKRLRQEQQELEQSLRRRRRR
jgi:hypothetical protein